MPDSTLSAYASTIGESLVMHDWPVAMGWPVRGVVLIVHGLGEHIGRYVELADRLNQWGFAVRGYDQYGHGESIGVRGDLPSDNRLIDDLAAVIDDTRLRMDDRLPLILLGHSMGALVAGQLVARKLRRVEALVMASPAIQPRLNLLQRLLIRWLSPLLPIRRLASGLDARYLSHDDAVVRAYRADPLVHPHVSTRLAHFIEAAGRGLLARAPRWRVPTLLMWAGQDRIVSPAGSQAFAQAAPPQVLSAQVFPLHYHELFNEIDREPVYASLQQWLSERFAPIVLDQPSEPAPGP